MKNLFWLSVLIFSAFVNISFACTRFEFGVPIQAEFTRANAVFIGKAIKVEHSTGKDDYSNIWSKVHFKIQQNFKGAETPTFTIVTNNWRAACGLKIKKGQTWIIYAHYDDKDKIFRSIIGNKYNSLEDKEEVEILKLASERKTDTTISGRVTLLSGISYKEAVEITVEGNGIQQNTTTKPDGTFNVAPLTAGNYKVKMKFPFDAYILYLLYSDQTPVYNERRTTLLEYEVKLKQGDHSHSFFEIQ